MNRREAISRVGLILGGTVIGAEFFIAGCKSDVKKTDGLFTADNVPFLDEIGETILPETSTPGAKATKIGDFMTVMVKDCYTPEDQQVFIKGISQVDDAANKKFNKKFMDLDAKQKTELLTDLDKEQKDYSKTKKPDDPNHYFTMMKQLTLLGYFTSELGCTKALRYVPVPGKYEGCIPYKKGDRAWALS
ncbi:gluconate 2-dehydrogenase subunit 3 family protein [Mucilaginibacter segetis]|uniref:Gluconate 2-dehydrogenase subunit 3 family protein n=1 Tax=Mucilaginibacter segetis TaxID=2793071 RepID=A0A934PUC5_9SPHI|nr:gluconate 2-dehydrogenase subunit 3 family protein [Mucilaginibacter segetis]MBK0381003.1 gluconate 2-dehydrogenase subunit 3 family protein [Mucilaginibacter segetis]